MPTHLEDLQRRLETTSHLAVVVAKQVLGRICMRTHQDHLAHADVLVEPDLFYIMNGC